MTALSVEGQSLGVSRTRKMLTQFEVMKAQDDQPRITRLTVKVSNSSPDVPSRTHGYLENPYHQNQINQMGIYKKVICVCTYGWQCNINTCQGQIVRHPIVPTVRRHINYMEQVSWTVRFKTDFECQQIELVSSHVLQGSLPIIGTAMVS